MGYTPQQWADLDPTKPASATRFAYMEGGIAAALDQAAGDARYPRKGDLAVSIRDYGAKGDGTTDDTAAIQAGLAAGGTLFFPPGTYLSGALTISKQVDLLGAGRLNSIIKLKAGTNADLFTVQPSSLPKISRLFFDGNSSGNTSGHIFYFPLGTGYQGGADFTYCTFKNAAADAINVSDSRNNGRIFDCFFGPSVARNVWMGGTDWIIRGSTFGDCATNIYCNGTALSISDSYIFRGSDYNINVENSHYVWIRGCSIDSGGKVGIRLAAVGSTTPRQHLVEGNIIFDNSKSATGTYSAIVCEQVDGPVISGNSFFHYPNNSIPKHLVECVTAPTNITFIGNTYTATDYATSVTNDLTKFATISGRDLFRSSAAAAVFTGTVQAQQMAVVRPTATGQALAFSVQGEPNQRLILTGDGKFNFGDGANATDVNFYRDVAGRIRTDGGFRASKAIIGGRTQTTYSSGTLTIDASQGVTHEVTLNANVTAMAITNAAPNQHITLVLLQDATGGRTVTWPTIRWADGSPPTLSTTAAYRDFVTLYWDGSSWNEVSRALAVR